jgi:hypothetical protein
MACPFPGLENWKSVMTHGSPSISIFSPFFKSDALYMGFSLQKLSGGLCLSHADVPRLKSELGVLTIHI